MRIECVIIDSTVVWVVEYREATKIEVCKHTSFIPA